MSDTTATPEPPRPFRHGIFNYFAQNHGLTLTESEMVDIERVVSKDLCDRITDLINENTGFRADQPSAGFAAAHGSASGSTIPAIQSAVLNIGAAMSGCASAREAWIEARWNDATMWLSNSIAQLEFAKEKIYARQEAESSNDAN